MNKREMFMQEFKEGRFGRMKGEEITDDELAAADRRKQAIKSGQGTGGEDGVFETDDSEDDTEETPETK